ncbi:hypothetical protein Q8G38_16030 [Halomonas venusta]|uniref:hypothetical protein n=1 Tax=Vreelandella venusta TaxID=44935 RepID=UPI00295E9C6F|nr:hypothetical protein [Halomonas venusta]MDW0360822.1 hypothetical protein [Halomonas venusta]
MFTVKYSSANDHTVLEEAQRDVVLIQHGETDYDVITKGLDQKDLPRVIIQYQGSDGERVRRFIYADDRAWIMNANGKTVATV